MSGDVFLSEYESCRLCARNCGKNRTLGNLGFCKMTSEVKISRAALHFWEEPIISGNGGSGTIFFSGCSLGCIFCQNRQISRAELLTEKSARSVTREELAEIMLTLMKQGAHNINLVTPTHYAPSIVGAVGLARKKGMTLPIVYNTASYDTLHTVDLLHGTVDIYLADFKYYREKTAKAYSCAADYMEVAKAAIEGMVKQRGEALVKDGIMRSGVIVRVLLLPGHVAEAKLTVKYLYETYGDSIFISLMNQYTPMPDMPPPLSRTVTEEEYAELVDYALAKGITNAFIQESGTAKESFIPDFNGEVLI